MIFWEEQSWETGGGRWRLTLWADGKSEIRIVLGDQMPRSGEIQLRPGWKETDGGLVKSGSVPQGEARDRFERALQAGIHLLQPVRPNYLDGSGTVVGFRSGGQVQEVVIAHLLDEHQGTANHRRFQEVAAVMSDFDRDAILQEE